MKFMCKDFRDAYYKINSYLFFQSKHDWLRGTVTAHNFHVDIEFASANCDLQMSEVNYTSHKWAQLIRSYLDPVALGTTCARLLHYKNKGGKHKYYVPDIGMAFKERRNASGSCLMAMTVGYNLKDGWHVEIFTRASELTMRWFMDLIFIHVLIREIGNIIGFSSSDCKVYWHMVSTYQSITSMPLFLIMTNKEDWMTQAMENGGLEKGVLPDWQWGTLKRFEKCYLNDNYSSFKVQKRPAEMYKIIKGEMEPKKAVLTEDLLLPDIDINQQIDFAEEENLYDAGGAR